MSQNPKSQNAISLLYKVMQWNWDLNLYKELHAEINSLLTRWKSPTYQKKTQDESPHPHEIYPHTQSYTLKQSSFLLPGV